MRAIAFFAGVFLLVLAAASCGKREEPKAERAAPPEVVAAVGTASETTIRDYYDTVGTVRSRTTSAVSSQIVGTVVAVRVREGDRVKAGQVLVEVEAREARAQLDKARAGQREAESAVDEAEKGIRAAESALAAAEANQELAAATFRRYEALLERRSASPQEFDEVRAKSRVASAEVERARDSIQALRAKRAQVLARIDQAKADIATAEAQLGYAKVVSAISGIVIAKPAEPGMLAGPGVPLVTVEDASRYRLEAVAEESKIGLIRVGDPALLQVDALGSRTLEGRVSEIVPAADPASRTYTVRIDIERKPGEPELSLRSGLFGRARFPLGERTAVAIPRSALVERGQLVGVYAVDPSGIARLRLVKAGKEFDGQVEVLSGLSAGERIVVDGAERVSDGARIKASEGSAQGEKR